MTQLSQVAELSQVQLLKFQCGFIASKKGVHKRAHERNRAKRRLRGLCEQLKWFNAPQHMIGIDHAAYKLLFLANKQTSKALAQNLKDDFLKMLKRISE